MIENFDAHKQFTIEKDVADFAAKFIIDLASSAIAKKGIFSIALSGGSTPKILYGKLKEYKDAIDWSKVLVFFSDERSVALTNEDSNYHMAMTNGIESLGIPKDHIFAMKASESISENADLYEEQIKQHLADASFDLILLGMGDDGHAASLFPATEALDEKEKLVIANDVPQKKTKRMTFTYPLLKKSKQILFLTTGANKAEMVKTVLTTPSIEHPASLVTNHCNKVLWALDEASASLLK